MKINTQNQSRFLSRDDLATPLVATMDRVTEDATLRNPQVLHFAPANRLKPLPMNVTNRRILVAAYGDDPTAWHGRPVEVYFNPSIPNPSNPAQPGGICVRIPLAAVAVQPGPAARQAVAPKPAPSPPPLAAERAQALEGFRRATTKENADRWKLWADSLRFDDVARTELNRAHAAALERCAAQSARRPAPVRA